MKRVLLVLLAFSLAACLPTTPPPPTPVPASPTATSGEPSTVIPPPTNTATALPPTETPTLPPTPPEATTFPNPDAYTWETVVSGLDRPVDLKYAPDNSGRMFIVEKVGRILILQDGKQVGSPFLDISDRVGSGGSEQGLLGLAFHPHYAENGFFFVNYTDKNGNTVIARYHVTADPNVAVPNSELVLLHVDQPFANHNGGMLTFGPDGYLYAGLGDGGSGGDPFGNAQNLNTFLGKILRLDVDSGDPYAIPPGNPFGTEIWDYGLRNPWRFSFDRLTGDLYIGDVGQNSWEEIDYVPAGTPGGLNFGWNYFEGTHPYKGTPPSNISFTMPVVEYGHDGGKCAVTGGYVYRGSMPEWNGIYLYGDYCTGTVWGLIHSDGGWQNQLLYETGTSISSFGQDPAGEVYLVAYGGQILRLVAR
jgi:glucose/arabinose dehydrogenase